MMTIELKVNGKTIREFKCWRIKGEAHEQCTYRMSDGRTLKHNYDDGLEELAVKVIKAFKKHHPKELEWIKEVVIAEADKQRGH